MRRLRPSPAALRWRAQYPRRLVLDWLSGASRRTANGELALTFDDGPHPGSTDRVLDVLAELDVRATFFCVGKNAQVYPDLVRRMRAEGHAVGSHSMTHPHPAETPLDVLAMEYVEGQRAVAAAYGGDIVLFRPPHGHLDLATAQLVRRLGLASWLWNVDTLDWRPGTTVAEVAALAGQARAGGVVLMHDWVEQPLAPEAQDRSATVQALPVIVAELRGRGLRLESLQP
jgi:peptidoglycan/xylan/chitin deacetylase (PgdA/CDA1 family)